MVVVELEKREMRIGQEFSGSDDDSGGCDGFLPFLCSFNVARMRRSFTLQQPAAASSKTPWILSRDKNLQNLGEVVPIIIQSNVRHT